MARSLGARLMRWVMSAGTAMFSLAGEAADGPWKAFPGSPYEPSGVTQLPDGRLLVVDDEPDHPLALLTLQPDGSFQVKTLLPQEQFAKGGPEKEFRKLDDLEGIALGPNGKVYAITSHNVGDADGKEAREKSKLVRFTISGEKIVAPEVAFGLLEAVQRALPPLGVGDKGFDIEGLAWEAGGKRLLLGLRFPVDRQERAVILPLENPLELFASPGSAPRLGPPLFVPLNGGGVRDLAFIPQLKGYLLLSGAPGRRKELDFGLWLWNGQENAPPQPVRIDGVKKLCPAEGIAPLQTQAGPRLILVCDDGKAGKEPGHYAILTYDQLKVGK
ncbi:MAG: DUF3616 domain-containing protein [Magnetococcales bacterium]|nr:DUF3616 domain-containing protein [Magnetococcales bacterium]